MSDRDYAERIKRADAAMRPYERRFTAVLVVVTCLALGVVGLMFRCAA